MKKIPHYDPTNDLIFKFVFGREERKNVTLSFINAMTGREGKNAFVDLDFQNPELVPDKEDDKLGRLDVFGILDNKTRVDIEMQVFNHRNMEKRSLFYWAHMYLHFDALKSGQGYLLEIPKYKNKPVKDMNRVERWLAYFANRLGPAEKEELAMMNPEIAEAMDASNRFMMDDKAYFEYVQRESAIWDYNNDMEGSREEGREEEAQVKTERFVRNLLAMKVMSHEDIAKAAETTVDEVERIAREHATPK